MTSKRKPRDEDPDDPDTPFLEWLSGAIGLALFLGALSVTVLNAMHTPQPPNISVNAEPPAASAGLFRVQYAAINSGDETAADVHLVARLLSGTETVEVREARIDLLPGHSTSHGGIFFEHDPTGLVMQITPVSYQEP